MLNSVLLLAALACPQESSPAPGNPEHGALERVVLIGASLSDGFGISIELDAWVHLGDVLSLALGGSAGKIESLSDATLYQRPLVSGKQQIDAALELDPTLVIAVDFPFWFGYGMGRDCTARLARFEACLEELERFKCPLLLGDFPDMTGALKGSSPLTGGRPMLRPDQIPTAACQKKLNQRLLAWAKERKNVHIWPLSRFVSEVTGPGVLEVRGNRYDAARKAQLLQTDLLHPTSRGMVAAAIQVLDHLVEAGWVNEEQVMWDAEDLHQALMQSTSAAREKKRASRKRREERRKQREDEARRGCGDLLLIGA